MDSECECLFCQRTDLNVYEINNNSILIGSSLIDFQEIIFEMFFAKTNDEVENFICEECKDVLTQFYIFKQNSKSNLLSSVVFDSLKEFMDSAGARPDPIIKCTETRFTVSFDDYDATEEVMEPEIEQVEEEEEIVNINHDEMMLAAEESEPYYEMETVNEECDAALTDQEYEVQGECDTQTKVEKPTFNKESIYQCECGAQSLTIEMLQRHMRMHKRKSSSSKLNCCDVGFKDSKCFDIHEKAHENFEAIAPHLPSFLCSSCRFMFSCEDDLINHNSQHEDGCQIVENYIIERRSAFDDHILRPMVKPEEVVADDDEDLFSCGHCPKKLNETDMKVHLLFFHTSIVFCPLDNRCFEGTKQIRLFSDHIRNKHPEIFDKNNLYSCRHCKENFATNFEKLAHMKKCDSKLFACENHCNKRFATEWLLKNHLKHVMGEERFSCEVCQKRCVSRSDLQIHCRSHTNERPYSCPICQKSFKTSANRSSHLDIHEREKRHECEVCGEKFQTRPILRKHKKKHDEKYQEECVCKICERKYISKPHLLRHLKTSHGSPADLSTDGLVAFFNEYFETHGR